MTIIKKYAENIEEELEDAKNYAEKYVEAKARNDVQTANKYREMASDELKHSTYLHTWAVEEIEQLGKVYTPPIDMQEKWEKLHREYIEKTAFVRQILSM